MIKIKLHKTMIGKLYVGAFNFAEKYIMSLLVLIMRLWIARIFWNSGLTKISNWQTTLFLFKHEYKVPVIPIELAAFSSTAIELIVPPLLCIGLMSRISAVALLLMTIVIEFTYMSHTDHIYWSMLLGTIICYGAGKLSLDYIVFNKCQKQNMMYKNTRVN